MGILSTKTTRGFYIGRPEAEAEKNPENGLLQFFGDFLEIQEKIDAGKFIISGRKGSGKSAFAQHIYLNSLNSDSEFSCIVGPQNFKEETVMQLVPADLRSECKSLLFKWIILINFSRFVVQANRGIYTPEIRALKEFLKKNAGRVEIDKLATFVVSQTKGTEFNITPLTSLGGTFRRVFKSEQTNAPFWALIPLLEDTISKVLRFDDFRDLRFTVFFDDLDIGFKVNREDDRNQLMDLIRVCKQYNYDLFFQTGGNIVLLLRDDICKSIKDFNVSDSAKVLDSYSYQINWYSTDGPDEDTLLRYFINKRVEQNFVKNNIKYKKSDPWLSFVDENSFYPELNGKTVFKFILDYTFYRPRDLVLFFNNIGDNKYPLPLCIDVIKKQLKKYVNNLKFEISNELSSYYSDAEIEKIYDFFKEMSEGQRTYGEVINMLKTRALDDGVFLQLVRHDFLVPMGASGHLYLSYREDEIVSDYEEYTYGLHKCIYKFFHP